MSPLSPASMGRSATWFRSRSGVVVIGERTSEDEAVPREEIEAAAQQEMHEITDTQGGHNCRDHRSEHDVRPPENLDHRRAALERFETRGGAQGHEAEQKAKLCGPARI